MNQRASILIIDDNPNNLRLLTQMLVDRDYKVRAVISGERALAAIQSALPDLILLDIMMPDMDGYEVCDRLKRNPATSDIPVIFISALGDAEGKVKAFQSGGVDYVTKPFQISEVLARVETHLALQRLRTDLQAANRELAKRLDELDRVNLELQGRNEELAAYDRSVSHDLKNPVGYILTSTEWLADEYSELSSQEIGSILRNVARSAHKANSIIESLLLLAQPQKIQCASIDMEAVVDTVLDGLQTAIRDSKAEISRSTSWPSALGQIALVERVWDNYLSNAIKYGGTPPRLEIGAGTQPDGWVRFWVRDHGPGLSEGEQKSLFTAFKRLASGKVEGHGLGLSIARRIVERMGGQVGVESSRGSGSTFYFTLPAAP